MRWAPRTRRRLVALVGLCLVAATAVPPNAGADEITDKRAEAEAIAGKIKQLDRAIERAAEAANGAQLELDQITGEIETAQTQVAAAEREHDARRGQLKAYAVDAYMRGTAVDLAASAHGDATLLGQRQGYLAAASTSQQDLVDQLRVSEADLRREVGELNKAKSAAESTMKQLEDQKVRAQTAVAEQNELYDKAQGELQTLVEEAQAREAQRQAAAAKARFETAAASAAASAPRNSAPSASQPAGGSPSSSPTSGPATGGSAPPASGGVAAAIEEAKRQLGKPYVWGAAGPGAFDCSGFTMWAWRAGGVSLPHYSGAQYSATTHVPMSAIQPGDLIFYEDPGSHVALYIGNGTIIHAPNSRSTVRYDSLYYWDTWMAATRP